jgi:hypothetical protein
MGSMRIKAWCRLGSGLLWVLALSACGALSPSSGAKTSEPPAVDAEFVQSLQQQIKERDKRIAELESQLEALKIIDQDMEKRRKPIRPPATLTPIEPDQGR